MNKEPDDNPDETQDAERPAEQPVEQATEDTDDPAAQAEQPEPEQPDRADVPDATPPTAGDSEPDDEPDGEPGPEPDGEPDQTDPAESTDSAGSAEQPAGETDRTVQAEPAEEQPEPATRQVRRRVAASRAGVLIGVLSALLGFALVVQLRTTSSTSGLSSARQEDLVRILDDLSSREDRLRQQIGSLETALQNLNSSGDKATVALDEARTRSTALGILTGTIAAQGPGVEVRIDDPGGKLAAEDLLDALEELRAAGAEAFQIGQVRIGVSSSFTGDNGQIKVDGQELSEPYTVLAIGDPETLAPALNIPGGVVANVRNSGGEVTITKEDKVVISALRDLPDSEYASPAGD